MDSKRAKGNGIRVELPQGTGESVALDKLVDDFLHGDVNGALESLHEPHAEDQRREGGEPEFG